MSSDFTVPDKRKLVDLARAIVERAELAGPQAATQLPQVDNGAMPTLGMHLELNPQAVAEFAASCRQQIEVVNRQVTKQLDSILLILERFEVELTALQGEVDGLRAEQQFFMRRLNDAEEAVHASADELVAQVSERFLAHLERVDRAAAELLEGRKQFAEATAVLLDKLQS